MKTQNNITELSKAEMKALRKTVFRQNPKIRAWSAFVGGFSVLVGMMIARGSFPDNNDWVACLILGAVLSGGFSVIFTQAIVEPRMTRVIEAGAPNMRIGCKR